MVYLGTYCEMLGIRLVSPLLFSPKSLLYGENQNDSLGSVQNHLLIRVTERNRKMMYTIHYLVSAPWFLNAPSSILAYRFDILITS